jgi:enoyl-CoA hydratase/carnithine racemase
MTETSPPTLSRNQDVVTVERGPDGVAVLRIDHPERNALTTRVLNDIQAAAEDLIANPPGAVVVWGGEKTFTSGGDPTEFEHIDSKIGALVATAFHGATNALAAIPRMTIAAITGIASGGGLEIALSCDFRVAANDAELGLFEITMGLFPGGGGTQRLPRLVGASYAKELIFSGHLIDAVEAARIGLVNKVVPAADVFNTAAAWAATFADRTPALHGTVKHVIERGLDLDLAEGLDLERKHFVALFDAWGSPRRPVGF